MYVSIDILYYIYNIRGQITAHYERRDIINKNEKKTYFENNYNTMQEIIKKYRNSTKYSHLAFELRRSKTTDSIYLSASTILNGKLIKKTIRWSDHPGNTKIQRGTNPRKKNKNKNLEKTIKKLIENVEKIRLKIILNKGGV